MALPMSSSVSAFLLTPAREGFSSTRFPVCLVAVRSALLIVFVR